jgi:hypothetical protein
LGVQDCGLRDDVERIGVREFDEVIHEGPNEFVWWTDVGGFTGRISSYPDRPITERP